MNLKVGDKVKIKNNLSEIEDFAGSYVLELEDYVGQILTVRRIEGNMVFLKENGWTWDIRALEKIECKFTKSDLKDGDVVTYRTKGKRIVCNNKLIDANDSISLNELDNYRENLTIKTNITALDIIKVERPTRI